MPQHPTFARIQAQTTSHIESPILAMTQRRLGNAEFLAELSSLLQSTNGAAHGSVFLTQKPITQTDSNETQILVRATNGKTVSRKSKVPTSKITKKHSVQPKIKLATVVGIADLDEFYIKYAEVCKKGMEGLRKRDKKKAKEKAKAKKKGKGQTTG